MKMLLSGRPLLNLKAIVFVLIITLFSASVAIGQTDNQRRSRTRDDKSTWKISLEQKRDSDRRVSIAKQSKSSDTAKTSVLPAGVNTLPLKFLFKFGKNGGLQSWGNGDGELDFPAGIAVNSLGHVYVVESYNDRVQVFDADGNYLSQFGSFGSGNGEFYEPYGIDIDSNDNVYIVDTLNSRVQKFDANGTFITTWGTLNVTDGNFISPFGIAIDSNDNVYIVDFDFDRVQKFDSDGNFILKWGTIGIGDGAFWGPVDIAVDSSDVLYVTDYGNDRIQRFDTTGAFLGKWTSLFPLGIAVDGNNHVWVVQYDIFNIQKTDSVGNFIFNFGSFGSGNGEFTFPQFIAIDSSNNAYISEDYNSRIQKFDSAGNFILKWGANGGIGDSRGVGDGEFYENGDVEIDADGNIFVTDIMNDRVQKFDSSGNYLSQFGTYGSGNGEFDLPTGIAFDSNGNIYVVDNFNDRIQKFGPDFAYITQWGTNGSGDGQFFDPIGIAIDINDRVFVADSGNDRIQVFDVNGGHLQTIGSAGTGDGQFDHPYDVDFDSANNFYVAEEGNERISKFDSAGNFLLKWGTDGYGNGQFRDAWGITIDGDDNVYVIDKITDIMQKFDTSGTFLGKLGGYGSDDGEFVGAEGITSDSNGYIYISDTLNNRVQVFGPTGSLHVSIDPAGAIAAGAKWRIDGGSWRDSGTTASDLLIGNYTVEFSSITGWTKPVNQAVTINAGQTTSISGTYAINYYNILGTIKEGVDPVAGVNVHFSHDGSTLVTDASGNYATSAPFGTTTTITPSKTHYTFAPTSSLVAAIAGNTKVDFQATFIIYNIHGTIKEGNTPVQGVRLNFSHDGSTVVTGSDGTYVKGIRSGTTTTVTPTKTYYSFSPTDSLIELIASNTTLDFAATFNGGSVRIVSIKNLNSLNSGFFKIPEGAGWRIVGYGVGSWMNFDETLISVPSGEYTIEFRPVPCFITPANITLTVEFGEITSIEISYLCPFIAQGSDYNGDGTTDLAVFDPETNEWHVAGVNSTAGGAPAVTELFVRKFGVDGSTPAPGDYDNDGMTDLAYWNAATGVWRVDKQFKLTGFGKEGDIAVPADFIGDGRTEPALYRPADGLWLIYDRDSKQAIEVTFGSPLDIPVPGDYNGDGITDIAIWNSKTGTFKVAIYRQNKGTWKINRKLGGKLGGPGHIPVPADYDGDGMIDFAVYRLSDSTWSIAGQSDVQFGNEYSVPLAIDWNGDGSAQITIFGIVKGQWRSDKLRKIFGKGMRPISGTN